MKTTIRSIPGPLDQLCCGSAGRIDIVGEVAWQTSDLKLAQFAQDALRIVADRAAVACGYKLYSTIPADVRSPGLFQGLAGIGYTLLRLARPNALPAILAFD